MRLSPEKKSFGGFFLRSRRPLVIPLLLLFLLPSLLLLFSCAPARRPAVPPSTRGPTYQETGYASWYGKEFHGRPTSSGEIYDMHAFTAAHRTLPLGTVAEVFHLGNGRSVRVRINDRGPFVANRIIDLPYRAAKEIDMADQGLARVRLVAWPREADLSTRHFTVQVGSFQVQENAKRFREKMGRYGPASITQHQTNRQLYYRVRVGNFRKEEQAQDLAKELMKEGFSPLVICAE